MAKGDYIGVNKGGYLIRPPEELKKALKIEAIKRGMRYGDLITLALAEWIRDRTTP